MKYKILIIDDEEMILSMMEKCLKEKFSVYTANNAKKALALLNGGNVIPDIILLDINMPEMDGLELCQHIRSHISCPIIFLTARVTEQDVIKGLSVGGDDYITKPFGMDELVARILSIITAILYFTKKSSWNFPIKNLRLFDFFLKMQGWSLTGKLFMKNFGDMMGKATVL